MVADANGHDREKRFREDILANAIGGRGKVTWLTVWET